MLKRLGYWKYVMAIAVIWGCAIYVSHQYEITREQCDEKSKQIGNGSISPAPHYEESGKCQQNAERNFPRWYRLFSWPEGITTWAILFTLLAIAEQTTETSKAAQSALLNAQAVINAERPWILVVLKNVRGPMGGFTVHARNRGHAPAIIIGSYIGCALVKNISGLPEKASYFPGSMVKDRIIPPDGAVRTHWFDTRHIRKWLNEDIPPVMWMGQVFVFGKIVYRNLANPNNGEVHETRWISLYQPPVGDELGNSMFRIEGVGASEEYERYT
ncbi:MAG: hypothetical protein WAM85_11980 [Terracidiphilus sp.]